MLLRKLYKKVKYSTVYNKYRDYTMIPDYTYRANLEIVEDYLKSDGGAIVECGVWRGGMIAGIADMLGNGFSYYLYDSFEGLPDAKEIDGEGALNWQADKESDIYFDNCKAEMSFAQEAMKKSKVNDFNIVKGWYDQTLGKNEFDKELCILRLDSDWYDSTMTCLNALYGKVLPGGLIIIDDYYMWDGCTKAVHDFLSNNKLKDKLRQHKGVSYIVKE